MALVTLTYVICNVCGKPGNEPTEGAVSARYLAGACGFTSRPPTRGGLRVKGRLRDYCAAHSPTDSSVSDLIERSSLGTPEARAARSTVSDEKARELVERSNRLAAGSTDPSLDDTAAAIARGDLAVDHGVMYDTLDSTDPPFGEVQ